MEVTKETISAVMRELGRRGGMVSSPAKAAAAARNAQKPRKRRTVQKALQN